MRNDVGTPDEAGLELWSWQVPKQTPLIAIVDDDESVREATKSLMRSCGFTAETFRSGEDFLASPHLARTDCLVADVNMTGMTGLDLHRRLVEAGRSIPTILITASPNDGVRSRALNDGVISYLTKPCDEQDLLLSIRSALSDAGAEKS
jgi:FixJ family two-component response regulator